MRDGQKLNFRIIHENRFKVIPQARVQDDAQLEKSLGKKMYDAHCEIGTAVGLELNARGYPYEASFLEKIPSTGGYEYSIWVTDRLEMLDTWRANLKTTQHYAVCFDICVRGITIKSCAWERSKSRNTISKYLREALNEWCIIRGWGDQIEERQPIEREKYQRPTEMIDLQNPNIKIIIFENDEDDIDNEHLDD